jgi:serine/threonine protein kinase
MRDCHHPDGCASMSDQGQHYCARCGARTLEGSPPSVCVACGYEPPEETVLVVKCYHCGGDAPAGSSFCPSCGQPFTVIRPARAPRTNPDDEPVPSSLPPAPAGPFPTVPDFGRAESNEMAGWGEPVAPPADGGDQPANVEPKESFAWKRANTSLVFDTLPEPRREPPRRLPADNSTFPPFASSKSSVGDLPPLAHAEKSRETEAPGAFEDSGGMYASLIAAPRGPRSHVPPLYGGDVIAGRYRVKRSLGSGGFANIYLVTDSEDYLQEEIVLKLVDENLMRELLRQEGEGELHTHDDLIRAWRSKLKVWKVISEQEPAHIVRLLGVPRIVFERESSFSVGMLMEYMPGGDLWQYFQKRGVPRGREQLTETMRLFLSACRAVGVLHENGLLHRDIKPSNFLLNPAETQCKLTDFELIMEADETASGHRQRIAVGTPIYMAPECMEARYSVQSDIFALGAMLYHLLTGEHPRSDIPDFNMPGVGLRGHRPVEPSRLNPLVTAELSEAVLRCLDDDPAARPSSVAELTDELTRLGLTGDAVNIAPVNLARLLLTHLPPDEVRDLVESLEEGGFYSASAETEQRQKDILEEYCYTASPYDVLRENCTTRQLRALTESLGLAGLSGAGRDDLIEEILTSVGFLASAREVPGIEASRTFLENLRLNLAHATTMDECVGMIQAGLSAVERTVELLLSFYGQLLLGTKFPAFLKTAANGKPPERLTFGQKLGALRQLCTEVPAATLPVRIRKVFKFPLISADVFERLSEVVRQRNLSAHSPQESTRRSLALAQRSGRQLLEHAVASLNELAQNTNVPRVVQIVSRQDDIYGRHFYLGRDDRGRSERIFTPLPLNVGRLYLFFPLTNPARINPLIYPFDSQGQGR